MNNNRAAIEKGIRNRDNILRCRMRGMMHKEIAAELGIDLKTEHYHWGVIKRLVHESTSRLMAGAGLLFACFVASSVEFPPVPELHGYLKAESKRGAEKLMIFPRAVKAPIGGPAPVTFAMRATPIPVGVTLAWDASPSTNVDGYAIYGGPSFSYFTNRLEAGTNLMLTVTGLESGQTYFFVAQAYNSETNSEFSNVVEYTVPASMVLSVRTLSSSSLNGPWAQTGIILLTNPTPPLYFKLGITQQ